MSTIIQKVKRNAYGVSAFLFAATVLMPSLLVGSASAEQITARSIEMSNSSIGTLTAGQSVKYNVTFTPATSQTDITRIVIAFCAESPLIGSATCTKPTGMTVGTATPTASVGTWTGSILNTDRTLLLSSASNVSLPSGTPFTVEVSGFTNPSTVGQFFARILTYRTANAASAASYDSNVLGTYNDYGGIAMSTTDDINVSAAVMETLIFCVSAVAPGANCTGTSTPSLTLGSGTPPALSTSVVDDASAYFQVSTNAAGNTYINMKSGSSLVGGLDSGSKDIDPIDQAAPTAITAGTEKFGMRVLPSAPVGGGSGTITGTAAYADNTASPNEAYNMRTPEVIGTYGDRIASASGALDDVNVGIDFAASINNTTSAGLYTADISLIATSSY